MSFLEKPNAWKKKPLNATLCPSTCLCAIGQNSIMRLCVVYSCSKRAISALSLSHLDARNLCFFLTVKGCYRWYQQNHLLLNSEVFMWPSMWRVLCNWPEPSQLSFICVASEPSHCSCLGLAWMLPLGWRMSWLGIPCRAQGLVCTCVCFSLSHPIPKANIIDFWNHCKIAHAFSPPPIQITESWV